MPCDAVSFQSAKITDPIEALGLIEDKRLSEALVTLLQQQEISAILSSYPGWNNRARLVVTDRFGRMQIDIRKDNSIHVKANNKARADALLEIVEPLVKALAVTAIQAKIIEAAKKRDPRAQVKRLKTGYTVTLNA